MYQALAEKRLKASLNTGMPPGQRIRIRFSFLEQKIWSLLRKRQIGFGIAPVQKAYML